MDAKRIPYYQWVSLLVRMKKWRGPRGAKLIVLFIAVLGPNLELLETVPFVSSLRGELNPASRDGSRQTKKQNWQGHARWPRQFWLLGLDSNQQPSGYALTPLARGVGLSLCPG